ncbi:hypothetical protein EDC04DRAFT_2604352 [Pisolithus marmoratus]|nr:hypothetical protein EDC04DRAFT_2604352 [Pisolithus marmoratus]
MQSALSNVHSPAQKGTDPSVDDLAVQISKLSFMLEAAEKIMVAICHKTMQLVAPSPPKSGEDKQVFIGLTPHPSWVGPMATMPTVQSTLSSACSPPNFLNIDMSFNEAFPCGPTPPISHILLAK